MSAKPIDRPVNPFIKARRAGVPIVVAVKTGDVSNLERDADNK